MCFEILKVNNCLNWFLFCILLLFYNDFTSMKTEKFKAVTRNKPNIFLHNRVANQSLFSLHAPRIESTHLSSELNLILMNLVQYSCMRLKTLSQKKIEKLWGYQLSNCFSSSELLNLIKSIIQFWVLEVLLWWCPRM